MTTILHMISCAAGTENVRCMDWRLMLSERSQFPHTFQLFSS